MEEEQSNIQNAENKLSELIPERFKEFFIPKEQSVEDNNEPSVFRLYEKGIGDDILQLSWMRDTSCFKRSSSLLPFIIPNPKLKTEDFFDYLPVQNLSETNDIDDNLLQKHNIEWPGGTVELFLNSLLSPTLENSSKLQEFFKNLERCECDQIVQPLEDLSKGRPHNLVIQLVKLCPTASFIDMILEDYFPRHVTIEQLENNDVSSDLETLISVVAKSPVIQKYKPSEFRKKLRGLNWSNIGILGAECERHFAKEYYQVQFANM